MDIVNLERFGRNEVVDKNNFVWNSFYVGFNKTEVSLSVFLDYVVVYPVK